PDQTGADGSWNATYAASTYSDNCGEAVTAEFVRAVISNGSTNCNWTVTYNFNVRDVCGNYLNGRSYTRSGSDQTAPTGSGPAAITGVNACMPDQTGADGSWNATYAASTYSDNCGEAVTAEF